MAFLAVGAFKHPYFSRYGNATFVVISMLLPCESAYCAELAAAVSLEGRTRARVVCYRLIGVLSMSKEQNRIKETKKKPALTQKEKKVAKREKKDSQS